MKRKAIRTTPYHKLFIESEQWSYLGAYYVNIKGRTQSKRFETLEAANEWIDAELKLYGL